MKYNIFDYTDKARNINNGFSKLRHTKSIYTIMIHHTASEYLGIENLIKLHTKELHKWPNVGYHFYVNKDNSIFLTANITDIVNGCLAYNSNTIHICFEGNYQFESFDHSLVEVFKSIDFMLPKGLIYSRILKHRDKKNTLCPGTFISAAIDDYNTRNTNQLKATLSIGN